MSTTLLSIGLACIIAAIVGGGLKAFQIEIPVLQSTRRQIILGAFGCLLLVGAWLLQPQPTTTPLILQGSVMRDDADPVKRNPLKGVQVIDADAPGLAVAPVTTDENGLFKLHLKPGVHSGQSICIQLTQAGYQTKTAYTAVGDEVLYTFYLWPDLPNVSATAGQSRAMAVNFAYAADPPNDNRSETFQIPNLGNIRCNGREPCSPDHKWKANVVTSPPLDAGAGNVFASVHAECIAGPCAWTQVEPNGEPRPGQRTTRVRVRNWSDTVTYRLSGKAAPR